MSDTRNAFAAVLKERGYYLAKGDRRGHVVVDWRGEIYSVARMLDQKPKEVRQRLGKCEDLPSVDATKAEIARNFGDKLKEYSTEIAQKHAGEVAKINKRKQALTVLHRHDRARLKQDHEKRWIAETKARSERLPRGLKAFWFRVTGKYKAIKQHSEAEAKIALARDRGEMQALIDRQLSEQQRLQTEIHSLCHRYVVGVKKLSREMATFLELGLEHQNDTLRQIQIPKRQRQRRGRGRGLRLSR